jgi:hypothetical protein
MHYIYSAVQSFPFNYVFFFLVKREKSREGVKIPTTWHVEDFFFFFNLKKNEPILQALWRHFLCHKHFQISCYFIMGFKLFCLSVTL